MTVDIFEPVIGPIGGWHQLNNAFRRMGRNAGCLVKHVPSQEICFDIGAKFSQHLARANLIDDPHHVLNRNKGDNGQS